MSQDRKQNAGERPDLQPKGSEPEERTPRGSVAADKATTRTSDRGEEAEHFPKDDSGIYDRGGTATTPSHGVAVEGGKLAGNQDDFEGEMGHPVPRKSGQGLSNDKTQDTGNPDPREKD
jgi:hypothetical protein